eukprot:CAMPEP_0185747776 /NCGR_PEP_ID=MMETSP1174-20130828/6421_1 /TAXON_ID=35687 /ORGANISM="Dictyocha speculum, Strain CCMP1381" /LENGTH=74 /DNA_ID=CAMNT_0028423115 /DNA_START=106 /DNA_END=327 /DNA_ORIENTATION=-
MLKLLVPGMIFGPSRRTSRSPRSSERDASASSMATGNHYMLKPSGGARPRSALPPPWMRRSACEEQLSFDPAPA